MFEFKPFLLKENPVAGIQKPPGPCRLILNTRNNNTVTFCIYGNQQCQVWSYNLSSFQYKLEGSTYDEKLPCGLDITIGITSENNNFIFCCMNSYDYHPPFVHLHTWNLITNDVSVIDTNNSDIVPKNSYLYPKNLIRHGDYYYTIFVYECDTERFIFGVYRLHIGNNSWECVYDSSESDLYPLSKSVQTFICDGKMIYCLIYMESEELLPLCKISGFNLVEHKWSILDTIGDDSVGNSCYPIQRRDFNVTQYQDPDTGDTCGILSGVNHKDRFNYIWRINLKTLTWTCLGKFGLELPYPIHLHSTAVTPAGRLVLRSVDCSFVKNNWESYSIFYSAWLRVPKLTDICWDAVLHYYPDLPFKSEEEIASYGIPIKFFQSRIS